MSEDLNSQPWGAQDRFQAHFIVKTGGQIFDAEFLAKTKLKTKGHFATKKVAGVVWVGGNIAETLNSDSDLTNMMVKLPYKDAQIGIVINSWAFLVNGKITTKLDPGIYYVPFVSEILIHKIFFVKVVVFLSTYLE